MLSRLRTTRWATRVGKDEAVWIKVERARQINMNLSPALTSTPELGFIQQEYILTCSQQTIELCIIHTSA